ncbi:sulfate transporter isoform X3 [Festucalex cinctus]
MKLKRNGMSTKTRIFSSRRLRKQKKSSTDQVERSTMAHGDASCMASGDKNEQHEALILERVPEEAAESCQMVLARHFRKHCSCSPQKTKSKVLDLVPILKWLPRYQLRDWLLGDVMSGLIVGILLVPQSIAYSLLAGQDPIYALYTAFFSSIIYTLLGTSRHISVGIFGVLCLLVGQVVNRELALAGYLADGDTESNGSVALAGANDSLAAACDRSCYAITVGATVTFVAGVYQVLLGILQGWFTLFKTWISVLANLGNTNLCDLITSLACLLLLLSAKELNDRCKAKLKAPIPFELFVVIIATLASHFGHFNANYGSDVAGEIPTGFLPPQLPAWSLIPSVAADAFSIALVGFAITVSLSEMFAKKHGYRVDANQEMYAIGFCNILPSFFRCFATSAALTKTLVKESTGCQTQVSGLVSAAVLLLVLLVIAPVFHSLQKCVLAVIIVVNLRGALRKFAQVPGMWRSNRVDAAVWLLTMATSALVNTELGLLAGVLASAFCVLGRMQLAQATELGRTSDRDHYEALSAYRGLRAHPGVAVFGYPAPIYYANQSLFKKSLYRKAALDPVKEKARRVKFEKKLKAENGQQAEDGEGIAGITLTLDRKPLRGLVLDCSAVLFVDSAGVDALKEVHKDYSEMGVALVLARCNTAVLDALQRGGYFPEKQGEDDALTFFTIADAVRHLQQPRNGGC